MHRKYRTRKRKFYFTPTPKVTGVLFGFALIAYSSIIGVKQLKYNTRLFLLKDIMISGIKYLEETEVQRLANVKMNKPLFEISLETVANNFLTDYYIRAVSVSRIIPSTLLIDIQEREPVLFLLDQSIYMVDETGIILKKLPDMPTQGLPVVTGLTVRELLQERKPLLRALDIIGKIKEVDQSLLTLISEVHLQRDQWPVLFLNKGGAKVSLGDSHHYERIYVWSELFRQTSVREKLEQIKRIDFTFSDRIVIEYKT